MTGIDTLEPELVWQEDGHLGEVAITALADGELDLLPATARDHAAICDACSERVGQAALQALALDAELAALAPVRRPLPVVAIAAALLLAVGGLLPFAGSFVARVTTLARFVAADLPLLARTAALLARSVSSRAADVWPFAWLAAAMVLFVTGLVVARLAPRRAAKDGGS